MMLKDGMLLYHGSYTAVHEVDLMKCMSGKDFGRGFYLTSDLNQAKRFITTSVRKARMLGATDVEGNYGFVSTFRFVFLDNSLSVYEFDDANEQWLWFVASNRRSTLATDLMGRIDAALEKADVIVGKVANDTTNPVITTYLNGLYGPVDDSESARTAIRLLLPNKLKDQFCFLTERAVACLSLVGVDRYEL